VLLASRRCTYWQSLSSSFLKMSSQTDSRSRHQTTLSVVTFHLGSSVSGLLGVASWQEFVGGGGGQCVHICASARSLTERTDTTHKQPHSSSPTIPLGASSRFTTIVPTSFHSPGYCCIGVFRFTGRHSCSRDVLVTRQDWVAFAF
jgi:hypothetical protein